MSDDGLTNSAILLMSLGEEEAAEVMKFLSPKEVQKLGQAMSKVKGVTREKIDEVLSFFDAESQGQTALGMDSDAYLRKVLTKALGPDKAGFILDRILQGGDTSGIEGLKWMDAASVAELLKNEHPQIIASVLVHLERDHAAETLAFFTERLRNDVVLRVATLDGIQPGALRELNDVLAKVLAGSQSRKKSALGGVRVAAEILNFVGTASETAAIETVR
jgi:flagellar motor switch protein FliG